MGTQIVTLPFKSALSTPREDALITRWFGFVASLPCAFQIFLQVFIGSKMSNPFNATQARINNSTCRCPKKCRNYRLLSNSAGIKLTLSRVQPRGGAKTGHVTHVEGRALSESIAKRPKDVSWSEFFFFLRYTIVRFVMGLIFGGFLLLLSVSLL